MYLSLRCWRAASDTSDMNDKRRAARHFRRLSVAGPTRRLLAGGRLVVRWRAKTDHPLTRNRILDVRFTSALGRLRARSDAPLIGERAATPRAQRNGRWR